MTQQELDKMKQDFLSKKKVTKVKTGYKSLDLTSNEWFHRTKGSKAQQFVGYASI